MVALRSHNGRTTMRSITTPAAATATMAAAAATGSGKPNVLSALYAIMPPIITNAPWAKFTMPLAL